MAKKQGPMLLHFVAWLTGVIVSLAVGFAMIGGTLSLPSWLGGQTIAMLAGWVVVLTTALGVVMVVLKK